MGKRIRIVIEYDLDLEDGVEPTQAELTAEVESWMKAEVDYRDLEGAEARPTIEAEVVDEWEGVGRD